MNALEFVNPARYFVDIGQDSVRAFDGVRGLELPLERYADGKLTEGCKQNLITELQKFIAHKPWQPRPRAYCAITARGVSLRRLSLPAGGKEQLHHMLPLQIEREFPLSPDQLAWGTQSLNGVKAVPDGSGAKQELLVAAVRKESLEEYAAIISACGASPVFTLGALARSYLCPQPPGLYTVLSLGRTCSELITIEAGIPVVVRVVGWGLNDLVRGESNPRYGTPGPLVPTTTHQAGATFGGTGLTAQSSSGSGSLDPLVNLINGQSLGRKVFVTGITGLPSNQEFTRELAQTLGDGVECHFVDLAPGATGSEAILGLQRVLNGHSPMPPLVLQLKQTERKVRLTQEAPLKLVAMAVGLAAIALLLPYFEALVLKSHVANKLVAIKSETGRLTTIDRELDFLQYLKESEPPYVDALLVLAKAAPPGTRFDSVSMNRRGEVSLRGSLRDGQQVAELRAKLIDSGFFASVGIEEQTPSPDRQKVTVRMSAQWKSLDQRKVPPSEPPKSTTDSKNAAHPSGPGNVAGAEKPVPAPKSPLTKSSHE
jgi:hypothetical protein